MTDDRSVLSGAPYSNGRAGGRASASSSDASYSPPLVGDLHAPPAPEPVRIRVRAGETVREIRVGKQPLPDGAAWGEKVLVQIDSQTVGFDDFDLVARLDWIMSHERVRLPDRCRCEWMGKKCLVDNGDLMLLVVHRGGMDGPRGQGLVAHRDVTISFVRPRVDWAHKFVDPYGVIRPRLVFGNC